MGLVDAIQVMADSSAPEEVREAATRKVGRELESWGAGTIRRRYAAAFRDAPSDWIQALIADALQHAMTVAVASRSRPRGRTDAAARSWLRAVVLNFVADEIRRRARVEIVDHLDKLQSDDLRRFDPTAAELQAAVADSDAASDLTRAIGVLRSVRVQVLQTYRPRDAQTLLRAIWVFLGHLAGATTDEQIFIWGGAGCLTEKDKPAQDRIYQMRRRGRVAIQRALADINVAEDSHL
jgi:DNA-directed RNA polymerase specialized sigma24 family protein